MSMKTTLLNIGGRVIDETVIAKKKSFFFANVGPNTGNTITKVPNTGRLKKKILSSENVDKRKLMLLIVNTFYKLFQF